jgi:hypothetical protein
LKWLNINKIEGHRQQQKGGKHERMEATLWQWFSKVNNLMLASYCSLFIFLCFVIVKFPKSGCITSCFWYKSLEISWWIIQHHISSSWVLGLQCIGSYWIASWITFALRFQTVSKHSQKSNQHSKSIRVPVMYKTRFDFIWF